MKDKIIIFTIFLMVLIILRLLLIERKTIVKYLYTKKILFLMIIVLVGIFVRTLFPTMHMITYDEEYYMQNAIAMIEGKGNYYTPGIAMGMLLSPSFFILGQTNNAAFLTTLVFSALSIVVIFYIGKILFNETAGLWSALFLTFEPTHIAWSNTSYDHIYALFFFLCFIFFLFVYKKEKRHNFNSISMLFYIFSTYLRIEFLIFLPCIILFHFISSNLKEKGFYRSLLPTIPFFLITALLIKEKMYGLYQGGPSNITLSYSTLENLLNINNYPFILVLIILALTPISFKYIKRHKKEFLFFSSIILLSHIFYSLMVNFNVRYFLVAYSILIILASLLITDLRRHRLKIYRVVSPIILILLMIPVAFACKEYPCMSKVEKERVLETQVPEFASENLRDFSIITDYPEIFVLTELDVAFPTEQNIRERLDKGKRLLFYEGYLTKLHLKHLPTSLESINDTFTLTPFINITIDNRLYYTFHEIK